jgi:hypothetical protein
LGGTSSRQSIGTPSRQLGGSFWPPVDWYYAPADSQHAWVRDITLNIRGIRAKISEKKQTMQAYVSAKQQLPCHLF